MKTNNSAMRTNRQLNRDSMGRFTNTKGVNVTRSSKVTPKVKTTTSLQTVLGSVTELPTNGSSFINRLLVTPDNLVGVITQNNPKVTYIYKPTKRNLDRLTKDSLSGKSIGKAYNANLKGREVARVIYP